MSVQGNLPICLFNCLSRNFLYNKASWFWIKSTFQLVFKTYKDKKSWSISVKNQAFLLQKKEMTHLSLNKNLWKLTILIQWKKKKSMKKSKKEKMTWSSWKRQIAKTKKTKKWRKIEEKELWGRLNKLNKEL